MVDQETFFLLNVEALKEMISAVGPRKKLPKKLRELQVNEFIRYIIITWFYWMLIVVNILNVNSVDSIKGTVACTVTFI